MSVPAQHTKTIAHVVGARPNYMKVAPLFRALDGTPALRQLLINTGQHYDERMAGSFVRDLELPTPDYDLEVGSASHTVQTAKVMMKLEEVCVTERPDMIVVVGDVNSTLAASLVAAKLLIPLAHVEAGLRSNDRAMPEEINRIVTDRLADLLLTPSEDADANLLAEGIASAQIHRVGNIMIDTLMRHLPAATLDRVPVPVPLRERAYAVLTLHRPSNVDDVKVFTGILDAINTIVEEMPVVFPVHPRTRQRLASFGLAKRLEPLVVTEPLGYVEFLALTSHARVVLTDSGGLQEESTALGIPCLTLRDNTERPITVTLGTNRIVGTNPEAIVAAYRAALRDQGTPSRPPLWDGHTSERIAPVLTGFLALT